MKKKDELFLVGLLVSIGVIILLWLFALDVYQTRGEDEAGGWVACAAFVSVLAIAAAFFGAFALPDDES